MLEVAITEFSYDNEPILQQINFAIERNEHLAILGESGSGKSTLLHLIYGLLELPKGSILLSGEPLGGPSKKLIPGHEFMKLLAQEFDVMPYISVAENIGSFLTKQDMEADAKRIDELLKVVDLEEYKHEHVKNLSGGQKQRVALAKALANIPEFLLLDEPFSHIDLHRKTKLRRQLFTYLKANNIGCIYATHDSKEALAFSDKILLLSKGGKQEMLDTPKNIYENVKTAYQASFFGEVNDLKSFLPKDKKRWYYPEQLELSKTPSAIEGVVERCYYQGNYYLVAIKTKGHLLYVHHAEVLLENSEIFIHIK